MARLAAALGAGGVRATAADSAQEAVAGADVVLLATTATEPWLEHADLTRPGVTVLHLSLRDLTPEAMAACDHVVDDPAHATREGTSLELAIRRAGLPAAAIRRIGDLLSGSTVRKPRRPTVYSPFGLGALDVAIADLVFRRARGQGRVIDIPAFFGGPRHDGTDPAAAGRRREDQSCRASAGAGLQ